MPYACKFTNMSFPFQKTDRFQRVQPFRQRFLTGTVTLWNSLQSNVAELPTGILHAEPVLRFLAVRDQIKIVCRCLGYFGVVPIGFDLICRYVAGLVWSSRELKTQFGQLSFLPNCLSTDFYLSYLSICFSFS